VGADRGDLRADVEVHELEAVEHVLGAQAVDRLDDLRRRQAELAALAARVGPLADALGHQPRADADVRPDADVARHADHHVELGEAVDHEDRGAAEALRHERGLDVAAVLVAVADEQRAGRVEQRECDDQLGLAADLEADPVRRAEADDLLHDVALLVDLDRVDAAEAAFVRVVGDRLGERAREPAHAARHDVREPHQERQPEAALLELGQQLEEIDRRAFRAARRHLDVTAFVDAEEAGAPVRDLIELGAVLERPTSHRCVGSQ
jgi:hypothetical protein